MIIDPYATKIIPSKNIKGKNSEITPTKSFSDTIESQNYENTVENPGQIATNNDFLFLQEMTTYESDKEKLKVKGGKLLKELSEIRRQLLTGLLNENNILELQRALKGNIHQFKSPELQELMDEIILRAEVELAKIERYKN